MSFSKELVSVLNDLKKTRFISIYKNIKGASHHSALSALVTNDSPDVLDKSNPYHVFVRNETPHPDQM